MVALDLCSVYWFFQLQDHAGGQAIWPGPALVMHQVLRLLFCAPLAVHLALSTADVSCCCMRANSRLQNNPLLLAEMERIERGQKHMAALDMSATRLDTPRLHDQESLPAWEASASNAAAQLEHQHCRCVLRRRQVLFEVVHWGGTPVLAATSTHICKSSPRHPSAWLSCCCRIVNLKLGIKHGPAAWKAHNARTAALLSGVKERRERANVRITETNQRRKLQQEKARGTLDRLQESYDKVVAKNVDIEVACRKLDAQVEALLAVHEAAAEAADGGDSAADTGDAAQAKE